MVVSEKKILNFLSTKLRILGFLVLVNLPLWIGTFDASNWSDDYQHTHLIVAKAKLSGLIPMIFEPWGGDAGGGHFAPVFALFNSLMGFVSLDPRFFHSIIIMAYILTAFMIYRLIEEFNGDRLLGIVSAVLFSLNYYIGFFGLTWNTMHVHVTNTLTGTISLFCLLRYLKTDQGKYLFLTALFLLLSILNIENGFVFYPAALIVLIFFLRERKVSLKKASEIFILLSLVMTVYPIGSHIFHGKAMPLGHRFEKPRSIQNYAYLANQMFIHSTGLTALYNRFIFNPLKELPDVEEPMKKLLRENNPAALKEIPVPDLLFLTGVGIATIGAIAVFSVLLLTRLRPEMKLFLWIYGTLFLIFLVVFYRIDVINALGIFSSILLAELILNLSRQPGKSRRTAMGILGALLAATVWTWADRFEDCYRNSYFGLSPVAVKGPDKIYQEMNRQIGHWVKEGLYLFHHDHRAYHETTGVERIGDMLDVSDYLCYNAAIFQKEFLASQLASRYRRKTFNELYFEGFVHNPRNKQVFVDSKEEAFAYLDKNKVDLSKIDAVYISRDYHVSYLNHSIQNEEAR